ncbi:MAG: tRNA uridine(34) 5-carboxymethylaminomethyl modification radical SAM/GNAT enzyme Elp3 [Nitrososphaerales archaeon]
MQVENEKEALLELARKLEELEKNGPSLSHKEIWKLKLEVCKTYGLDRVPKNSEILAMVSRKGIFEERLRRKSIRTRSGIAVVTAITKPFDCPHGTCIFCPGGVRFGTPQSYTMDSPAASFGITREFDPSRQVRDSLELLEKNGHDTSKVELILLGGTILAMPQDYQREFVKKSYDALNQKESSSLEEAIVQNETSKHRCVGLTIETKPDWCKKEQIDLLLSYGATRVEIGVQSLQDHVLKYVNRGHNVEDVYDSFSTARDAGFKIVAHMMPGLPLSSPEKDLEDLLMLVNDERLKPDMLKIYPTLVVEGTALFKQYQSGLYKPYSLEQVVDLLCKFKSQVPPWLRIMRIQREIPKHEIAGGAKAGNLRQIILEEMEKRHLKCNCIRCREIGHRLVGKGELRLRRLDYEASKGHEVFLSYEDEFETLYGFIRLRILSGREHRAELAEKRASMVRELHVYGPVVPVGEKTKEGESQHRGLGTNLLKESERISREEFKRKKQLVISASGTREYYRKRGYKDDGAFVSKELS